MKINVKKLIKNLIKEHEDAGFCTSIEQAQASDTNLLNAEDIQDRFYDAGRYEALIEVLYILEAN